MSTKTLQSICRFSLDKLYIGYCWQVWPPWIYPFSAVALGINGAKHETARFVSYSYEYAKSYKFMIIYFSSLYDTFPFCVYVEVCCMYSFLSMKHVIFLSNIAFLPFAIIKPLGLLPKTQPIQHYLVKRLDHAHPMRLTIVVCHIKEASLYNTKDVTQGRIGCAWAGRHDRN